MSASTPALSSWRKLVEAFHSYCTASPAGVAHQIRGTTGGGGPVTIRVMIVDDEDLGRRGIRALLQRAGDVEIVSECDSGEEAIRAISATQPELVYLDIQMPGKTGFDVIGALPETKCPHVIFVTAFDRFAIRAFEIHALDYLLKPVNEARFNESLARARAAVAGARDDSMIRRSWQMAAELRASTGKDLLPTTADRIPVKAQGRVVILRVAEIDWVEADGDYVSVHVGAKSWRLRETIGGCRGTPGALRFCAYPSLDVGQHPSRAETAAVVAQGTTVLYLPEEKILVTGDVISYPIPYFTPPLSQHAKSLRSLAQLDAGVIIPGHGPAWHDKEFVNLEAELFESIVSQVVKAEQQGLVTVEEIQKAVDVEPLRSKFTHGDKELNAKFQSYVNHMIENASAEKRDGRKFTY